jgi:hypothetical protein
MKGLGDEEAARPRPQIHDLVSAGTERNDRLGLAGLEHVEELVPPILNARRSRDRLRLSIDLALETIEERVDHHIGLVNAELAEKALDTLARRANKDSSRHVLIGCGILSDDDDLRRAIQATR